MIDVLVNVSDTVLLNCLCFSLSEKHVFRFKQRNLCCSRAISTIGSISKKTKANGLFLKKKLRFSAILLKGGGVIAAIV